MSPNITTEQDVFQYHYLDSGIGLYLTKGKFNFKYLPTIWNPMNDSNNEVTESNLGGDII